MNRKIKILKKRRLKNILKGDDYSKLHINDTYMMATIDYSNEELNGKICDLERMPLWDWFTLVNKKKNKIWYVDFSLPYTLYDISEETKEKLIESISRIWSVDDVPISFVSAPLKGGFFQLNHKDNNYEKKVDKIQKQYIDNNDWDKTISEMKIRNENNLKWDEGIQLNINKEKDGFGVIIPFSWKEKTFLEVFEEMIIKFNESKFSDKYIYLINELGYKRFPK